MWLSCVFCFLYSHRAAIHVLVQSFCLMRYAWGKIRSRPIQWLLATLHSFWLFLQASLSFLPHPLKTFQRFYYIITASTCTLQAPCTLHYLFSSSLILEVLLFSPLEQVRKLRQGECKQLDQVHSASKRWSRGNSHWPNADCSFLHVSSPLCNEIPAFMEHQCNEE